MIVNSQRASIDAGKTRVGAIRYSSYNRITQVAYTDLVIWIDKYFYDMYVIILYRNKYFQPLSVDF